MELILPPDGSMRAAVRVPALVATTPIATTQPPRICRHSVVLRRARRHATGARMGARRGKLVEIVIRRISCRRTLQDTRAHTVPSNDALCSKVLVNASDNPAGEY